MKSRILLLALLGALQMGYGQFANFTINGSYPIIAPDIEPSVPVGLTTTLTVNVANAGSNAPAGTAIVQVQFPIASYDATATGNPSGPAAALFAWTEPSPGIWVGTSIVPILNGGGGEIFFTVEGIASTDDAPALTTLNVQPTFLPPSNAGLVVDPALPIQLASFTAHKVKEESHLDWVTASELNNSHFEIQHSINGNAFETVGKIEGQGTVAKLSRYAYIHEYPVHGKNYYRLRQVDFDGATSFSDVKVLEFDLHEKLHVYPNPARAFTVVAVPEHLQGQYMELYDSSGKRMVRQIMDNAQLRLNIDDWPTGMYHIKVIESNESVRFVKNE